MDMRITAPLRTLLLALAFSTMLDTNGASAGPREVTLRAWNDYVATTEARIRHELSSSDGFLLSDFSTDGLLTRKAMSTGTIEIGKLTTAGGLGENLTVPDGLIAHWRGAVLVPGITLDALLDALQHPNERGPFQPDVVALRVRARRPGALTLAIRMTRRSIVTVTYDTEHLVSYRRIDAHRASSTSVSTRIVEIADAGTATEHAVPGDQDRGFLWKMNSYWRYEQVPGGVIVELESITLSRSVPLGLGRIVAPMIDRVARESITRTLAGVRDLYGRRRRPAA